MEWTKEQVDVGRRFITSHSNADELIVDEKTKLPAAAIYYNPCYLDEKRKDELWNLLLKGLMRILR